MPHKLPASKTGITLQYCFAKENPEWDAFVSKIHGANYEQTSVWAEICIKNNFCNEYLRIILSRNNTIIAGTQILIRNYGNYGQIGIISQGPCLTEDTNREATDLLIREIKLFVRKKKLLYLTIDIFNHLANLPSLLLKAGFKRAIRSLPPHPLIESTAITDLTKTEDELFNQFDPRRKRNIKTGLKLNFTIREGEREDIALFYWLMKTTCKRRGTKPVFSNIDYFYSIWDQFHRKGWVKLFFAEIGNNPVCTVMGFTFGDTFRYEYWGWNGEYAKEKITETFQWRNMLMVKEMGFRYYDYVQLDPASYKAILSEEEVPEQIKKRDLYGATYFKLLWRGTPLDYPGVYTYYRSGWVHLTMLFVSKLISLGKQLRMILKR